MIYFLITIVLVAIAVLVLLGLLKKTTLNDTTLLVIKNRWQEIEAMMQTEDPNSWVRAVMEADKVMDFALKEKRVAGTTMGERLKNGRTLFGNVQTIWEAHKLRNQLVHEVHASISKSQAERAVAQFRQGLRELKAL